MKGKFFILLILLGFLLVPNVYGQSQSIDVTSLYEISDNQAVDGDILIYTNKGIVRANVSFSNQMFGVLQDQPILVYRPPDVKGKPVVRSGTAYVSVSTTTGAIKPGDYITSSNKPGKGQKAVESGYVLGIALAELKSGEGKIPVAVRIEYAELTNTRSVLRLLDYFNVAAFQSITEPEKGVQLIKYFVAGLIVAVSLIISFLIFGRSIGKGIEAIGRNPLAKSSIQIAIMINVGFSIAIVIISMGIAFVILRL